MKNFQIPGVQIIFKLKYLEGASSITPFGDSKGIYYNKLYAFTEYKLEQLKVTMANISRS